MEQIAFMKPSRSVSKSEEPTADPSPEVSTEVRCPKCDFVYQDNEVHCPACFRIQDYPNVRAARAEWPELLARLTSAREKAEASGGERLQEFRGLLARSVAVVNVGGGFAFNFINSGKALYAAYGAQVHAGVRRRASSKN